MTVPREDVRAELVRDQKWRTRKSLAVWTIAVGGSASIVVTICWSIVRFTLHYT